MDNKFDKLFLGTGWAFPPSFSRRNYSTVMVSGEKDIKESLKILFSTILGERIMLPEYGACLVPMVFENIDSSIIGRIKRMITTAVLYYEPRIKLEELDVTPDDVLEGKLLVSLVFMIKQTNCRSNMVFPFYIIEGSNVSFMP